MFCAGSAGTISTHAPLAGRDAGLVHRLSALDISTHAPLAGRDAQFDRMIDRQIHFNPRAPCGARPLPNPLRPKPKRFQPTRPLRGATILWHCYFANSHYFNPRAPCGARRQSGGICFMEVDFNPRAPCGARRHPLLLFNAPSQFQPTRPLRGATIMDWFGDTFFIISTHAPLAGRDDYLDGQSP